MRLIDADKLEERWTIPSPQPYSTDATEVLESINKQPTIEAVPVVHGCNNNQNYHGVDEFRCSVCGLHLEDWVRHVHDGGEEFIKEYEFKHCPECGAMMKGGTQNSYRNRIIDEFAQKAIERLEDMGCEAWRRDIMAIAEEMKGGAE